MNKQHLRNVGDAMYGSGLISVTHDSDDSTRPILVELGGKHVWLTGKEVRQLRKALKPFAAPKAPTP